MQLKWLDLPINMGHIQIGCQSLHNLYALPTVINTSPNYRWPTNIREYTKSHQFKTECFNALNR